LSCALATQFLSSRVNFEDYNIYPALLGIYNPSVFAQITFNFSNNPFGEEYKFASLVFVFCMIICMVIFTIIQKFNRVINKSDVHGSADWAVYEDIKNYGLIGNSKGVYIGGFLNRKKKSIEYLKDTSDRHVLCFAPTRSGKGVGLVIPTLVSWDGSVIVYDIKGENWALTSGWRQEKLQSKVIKFDPTCNDGSSACFNPLFEIRTDDNEIRDVQNIADMLVDPDGKGGLDHWHITAHSCLVGFILHTLYARNEKSLSGVSNLLSDPERPIEDVLQSMLETEHDPLLTKGWINPSTQQPTKTHPIIAAVARELLNKASEERKAIISTANSFLTMYRDPIIARNTAKSDFTISQLIKSEENFSLYFIIPPSDISRTRPLVRLILNLLSRKLLENAHTEVGYSINRNKKRLLLMLDEFPSLGRIDTFQDALAYMAGYGIKAYIIAQDLAQLTNAYGRDESITGNCHIRISHSANKLQTADIISRMTGISTVSKISKSVHSKDTFGGNKNFSEGTVELGRSLLTPDEVLRLPEDAMIIFVGNLKPIYGHKIKYYNDPVFLERTSIPQVKISHKYDPNIVNIVLPKNVVEKNAKLNVVDNNPRSNKSDDQILNNEDFL